METVGMIEVAPNIFMITVEGAFRSLKPSVNVYVIAGPDAIVYDAGYGDRRSVRRLAREIDSIATLCRSRGTRFRIACILPSHTHPDHFAGLRRLRRRLGAPIALTAQMADLISSPGRYMSMYGRDEFFAMEYGPLRLKIHRALNHVLQPVINGYYARFFGISFIPDPEMIIEENGCISINGEEWEVFPSPGHSRDHISLYNRARGILLGGDNVLRTVTTWLGPPNSSVDEYLRTMERYLELPGLKLILAAHGSPVTAPHARIREIIDWRKERTDQVLSIIRDAGAKGISSKGIVQSIYPRRQFVKYILAEGWVQVTLPRLLEQGRVRRYMRWGHARYYIPVKSEG
jgi:glyoxylase-like metal-dependent hydrolase (beta-lactamase superfamily II)